jgi:uncharacterized protein YdhG (YjbR/CyaY superfamily)
VKLWLIEKPVLLVQEKSGRGMVELFTVGTANIIRLATSGDRPMQSKATTVKDYLAELPADRRVAISTVRDAIRMRLPNGYEEAMNWGMITYQVPLATCPDTYNGQPLMYAALASQKNHMAVYLMGIYMSEEARQDFETAYKATGKRFDVGKSCVRFKKLEDLPIELIGDAIASLEVEDFVKWQNEARSR